MQPANGGAWRACGARSPRPRRCSEDARTLALGVAEIDAALGGGPAVRGAA